MDIPAHYQPIIHQLQALATRRAELETAVWGEPLPDSVPSEATVTVAW